LQFIVLDFTRITFMHRLSYHQFWFNYFYLNFLYIYFDSQIIESINQFKVVVKAKYFKIHFN